MSISGENPSSTQKSLVAKFVAQTEVMIPVRSHRGQISNLILSFQNPY